MKSEEKIRKYKRKLELEMPYEIHTEKDKNLAVFTSGQILLLQWVLDEDED